MSQDEFILTGPFYFGRDRRSKPEEPIYLMGQWDGVEYLSIFTEELLAGRYVKAMQLLTVDLIEIGTPQRAREFLEWIQSLGCVYIGIDPRPHGPPLRVLRIDESLAGLDRSFTDGEESHE